MDIAQPMTNGTGNPETVHLYTFLTVTKLNNKKVHYKTEVPNPLALTG